MKSAPLIGGSVLSAYFLVTLFLAYSLGGEMEGTMVIAQLTNLHVTLFMALIGNFLPLVVVSNFYFQLVVGLLVSFGLGALIGMVYQRIGVRRKAV